MASSQSPPTNCSDVLDMYLKGDKTETIDFFKSMCTGLHIEDLEYIASFSGSTSDEIKVDTKHRQSVDRVGFSVYEEGICDNNNNNNDKSKNVDFNECIQVLTEAAQALENANLPTSFLLLFDEIWAILSKLEPVLANASGGCLCNMDLLCWYIAPGKSGFSPHRDRQPDDVPSSFRADGSPK